MRGMAINSGPVERSPKSAALPLEIVQNIISYIFPPHRVVRKSPSSGQLDAPKTLAACCLVSRVWYAGAVAALYETPVITGRNYDRFAAIICPSINAHIRTNGLANLVKCLDMGNLVHHGNRSLTARLLGRVKDHLAAFTAPQATFGYVMNCSNRDLAD